MTRYLRSKQIGNKGEAFFEGLISEHAIAHKIDGSKDVGLDFLCEWVYGEKPTRLLFGVQVKTRSNLKLVSVKDKRSNKNLLMEYKVNLKPNKKSTLDYWKGFDFPVFLFLVNITSGGRKIDCYYKRYTSILHGKIEEDQEPFYQVTDENHFIAFKHVPSFCGGFCRDLFFDHLRCQHRKGMLSGVDPKDLGLSYWEKDTLYQGVYSDYKNEINETLSNYKKYRHLLV